MTFLAKLSVANYFARKLNKIPLHFASFPVFILFYFFSHLSPRAVALAAKSLSLSPSPDTGPKPSPTSPSLASSSSFLIKITVARSIANSDGVSGPRCPANSNGSAAEAQKKKSNMPAHDHRDLQPGFPDSAFNRARHRPLRRRSPTNSVS